MNDARSAGSMSMNARIRRAALSVAVSAALGAAPLAAQESAGAPLPPGLPQGARIEADPTPHSEGALVAEAATVRAGEPFTVALRILLEPGWHTYWRNPGDSGTEALIDWRLPEGFTAGEILWPRPERLPYPPLMSYAYEDEVLLLTEIVPPETLPDGPVRIEADAEWLVCEVECVVAADEVALELPVSAGPPRPDPRWAEAFERTRRELPSRAEGWEMVARSAPAEGEIALEIAPPPGWGGTLEGAYFFPHDPLLLDHTAPQPLGGGGTIRLTVSPYTTELPARLEGVLALAPEQGAGPEGRRALAVDVPLGGGATADGQDSAAAGTAGGTGAGLPLATALLFALVGGVLLNLMPCVFPVLSLKVLGFVEHGAGDRRRARAHGFAFAAGVILSFLALAAVLLLVRAGGEQVGWGFQLQNPVMVTALIFLMVAVGLNFLGLLEFGTILTRLGRVGSAEEGYRGSFLTGVLATVVATPCTAPFMGAAVGTALLRPPMESLAIFAGLGVGMAAPYAVLASRPGLLRRLPKPGRWMETLRQALAFPMFAVAAWLLWVLGLQIGVGGATRVLYALLAFAFAAWLLGRTGSSAGRGRRAVRTAAAGLLAIATAWGILTVTGGAAANARAGAAPADDGPTWAAFDADAVRRARESGRPVFVDFTAAWCITCQVNERVVLASPEVQGAFLERDVALVRADWTLRDEEITRALASFGRSGVPLYVLYPPGSGSEPRVLPTVLTRERVLRALEEMAGPLAQEDP